MESSYILVIEDDDIVARTIERSLRGDEFRVLITNSGVEGLKAARRRAPDLVILDIIMPGMDGYTVCREMRSDPLLKDIPILFLTAKIKDEDKIAGFKAGADDYSIQAVQHRRADLTAASHPAQGKKTRAACPSRITMRMIAQSPAASALPVIGAPGLKAVWGQISHRSHRIHPGHPLLRTGHSDSVARYA